jgi:DNA repair exonuclease SbcCD ATPase subunit
MDGTQAWRPLGELIVERGLITQEDLEDALLEQRITHKRLGTILIDKGIVTAQQLTDSLVDQIGAEELLDELEQAPPSEDDLDQASRSLGEPLRRIRDRIHIDRPSSRRLGKPFTRLGSKASPLGHRRQDGPVAPFAPPPPDPAADEEPEQTFETAVYELVEHRTSEPEPEAEAEAEAEVEAEAEPESEPETEPDQVAEAETTVEPPELVPEDRHAWLVAARHALDEAETHITRLDNSAVARALELQEARSELATSKAQLARAYKAHTQAEEEIARLHALIDERDAGLTAMEGTVQELRTAAAETQAELDTTRAEASALRTRVRELETQVAELAENLSSTDETLGIEMHAREQAQRESKRLHEELDERDARVAKLARQVEALEAELEIVVAEREQSQRKLRSRERRVTKLESTLDELRTEQEPVSAAPVAEPEPSAEAAVEPEPAPKAAEGKTQTEGFLYFVPRAGEGYELVEQPGSAPAVGESVVLDGNSFVVTRHHRSPLPFDRRTCVYLRVS